MDNADERAALRRQKDRARERVHRAVKRGNLQRPKRCSGCGRKHPKIELHHHHGYGKESALDVVPLCHPCHVHTHYPPKLKYQPRPPRLTNTCWYCGEPFQTAWANQRYCCVQHRNRYKQRVKSPSIVPDQTTTETVL